MADNLIFDEIEIWKPIQGYENYFVSDKGSVNSKKRNRNIIIKHVVGKDGYCRICLYDNSSKQTIKYVHRLVSEAFGLDMSLGSIDHINGVKTDNNIKNLRACTRHQNTCFLYKSDPLFKGVRFHKRSNKKPWQAVVYENKKNKSLGYFSDRNLAQNAVKQYLETKLGDL